MVEVHSIFSKDGHTINKLTELTPKFIILEKIGSSGEVKILPRTFEDRKDVLDYLANIDDHMKHPSSFLSKKKIEYYIVPATLVEFLT